MSPKLICSPISTEYKEQVLSDTYLIYLVRLSIYADGQGSQLSFEAV